MDWVGRIIGAFYLAGGLIVIRQVWLGWRLDQMVVALSPGVRPSRKERISDAFIMTGGVLVTASGLSLLLLHTWSVAAVMVCWAAQAIYLLWAQQYFLPDTPGAAEGRLQTINAFTLYSLVAALTLWMNATGWFV